MQNPDLKGQRFIVAETNLHTTKFYTDILQKRFPDFKIQDGDDGDTHQVIDNSQVRPST